MVIPTFRDLSVLNHSNMSVGSKKTSLENHNRNRMHISRCRWDITNKPVSNGEKLDTSLRKTLGSRFSFGRAEFEIEWPHLCRWTAYSALISSFVDCKKIFQASRRCRTCDYFSAVCLTLRVIKRFEKEDTTERKEPRKGSI